MQVSAPQQQPQGGGMGKQGSGRHRKKKKFFQQKGPAPQPGNSIAPPQQHGRRKERQRGPRTFVGPMDHSYRGANSNMHSIEAYLAAYPEVDVLLGLAPGEKVAGYVHIGAPAEAPAKTPAAKNAKAKPAKKESGKSKKAKSETKKKAGKK